MQRHYARLFQAALTALLMLVGVAGAAAQCDKNDLDFDAFAPLGDVGPKGGPLEKAYQSYQCGDYARTLILLRPLVENGNASAEMWLGYMYHTGSGVPRNDVEAVKWYRLAADQGNAEAQSRLGSMYANGDGVPQDYAEAHMWLNLSAAQGNPDAARERDRVALHMSPAQIAEAQRLAREWKPKTRGGWWHWF